MPGKVVNERGGLSPVIINRRLGPNLHELDDIAVGIGDKGDPIVGASFARGALGMNIHRRQMANRFIDIVHHQAIMLITDGIGRSLKLSPCRW